jgi:hypothetical protein
MALATLYPLSDIMSDFNFSVTEEDEFMIPQETKQQIIPTVQPSA